MGMAGAGNGLDARQSAQETVLVAGGCGEEQASKQRTAGFLPKRSSTATEDGCYIDQSKAKRNANLSPLVSGCSPP